MRPTRCLSAGPNFIDRLESRRLLSAAITLSGSSGNNSFYLKQNADQVHIDIWQNSSSPGTGTPTQSLLESAISSVIINGQSGNDLVTQATALPMPIVFNGGTGTDTLNISAGTFTIAGDPGSTTSNLTINVSGNLFATPGASGSGIHAIRMANLNVLAGGSVTIDSPESSSDRSVLALGGLSINSTGELDLTGNDLIVHNGNIATLTSLMKQGYAGGSWKGLTGIASSFAGNESSHLATLGIMPNKTTAGTAIYSSFDNQTVNNTDALVKLTYVGDATLDGKVDGSDYSRIDSAFHTSATGWFNGDLNFDNLINGSDYTLIDNAYNTQPTSFSPLQYQLNHALNVAAEQSQRTIANLGSTGMYPQYVNSDGSLSLVTNTHWTTGTWPGILWNLYQATGNAYYKTQATNFTNPLSVNQNQNNDVGFRIYDSFYPLLQQSPGNAAVIQILLNAAAAKSTQFNATVGAFKAWRTSTSGNPAANFNVLMDLIMDSQLLFWAAKQSGNQTYYNQAVANAVIEETYLVHADGTSSQFAYFNSSNGTFVDNETYQGYSNTSTWARGETWAIYGFAQVYAATGRADFLATSEKVADWFIAHLPADKVPYWDFNDPKIPGTVRDTSAAAIAAAGLLRLSKLTATTDPTNSSRYRTAAGNILASLASSQYLVNPMTLENGVLLHGALNVPASPSIPDNPIFFGDYYFLEAINLYLAN